MFRTVTYQFFLFTLRCARLDIERRQDEKSCELKEFVDETIERLQLYISLLKRAKVSQTLCIKVLTLTVCIKQISYTSLKLLCYT